MSIPCTWNFFKSYFIFFQTDSDYIIIFDAGDKEDSDILAQAFEVKRKQIGKGKNIRFEESLAERPFYYEEFYGYDSQHDVARAIERINASVDEEEHMIRKVEMRIQVIMET